MPPAAAVFSAAFKQVMPGFVPAGLLDVGAGTGAASWAAAMAWPEISAITMLDRNPALRALARQLADAALSPNRNPCRGMFFAQKPKSRSGGGELCAGQNFRKNKPPPVAVDLWRICRFGPCAGRARHAGRICPHPLGTRRADRGRGACGGAVYA